MSSSIFVLPRRRPTDARPVSNLPLQLTSFIGREEERALARKMLLQDGVRLLTLTGPPGIGKTRLALQVGTELLGDPLAGSGQAFEDGVYFVPLAPITDPSLVVLAIGQALGVAQTGQRPLLDTLEEYLLDKETLLILDNFEQVVAAGPLVTELLTACPHLKALVTSRQVLRVTGEHEFPVPPLQVPGQGELADLDALSHYEAVTLFTQRARASQPTFRLMGSNASAVARICVQLDGLPLAIELAAARVKLLPPQAILLHLARPLALLTGGAQDLPARQQTLRNAIQWSHDLLNDEEKVLYRRLSVFVGGWTLEAAKAVCSGPGDQHFDTLEGLAALVDKSLVKPELVEGQEPDADGQNAEPELTGGQEPPRFAMLETIREYAGEKLVESGEEEAIKRRHALYFLQLAEQAVMKAWGPEELGWLTRLEQEHDNIRAALQWSHGVGGGTEIELRLVVALGRFWEVRGYLSEGRERIASVLSKGETHELELRPLRAWALLHAGALAFWQSDYSASRAAWIEALDIFRDVGDKLGIARTLTDLADVAREEGDYDTSALLCNQALAINRELGDTHGTAVSLVLLGWAEIRPGYYSQATAHLQEALALARQIENPNRIALALSALGEAMVRQGRQDEAITLLEESLAIRRASGYRWGMAASLGTLAWAALQQGDYRRAAGMLMESLTIRKELGDKGGVAWCLEKFAEIESAEGHPIRAAHLLGAARAVRQSIGTAVDIADRPQYEQTVTAVRTQLGEQAFVKAWEEGQAMTLGEAIAYAQSPPPVEEELELAAAKNGMSPLRAAKLHHGGLTSREHEIAVLIAQSKSNPEIAEELVVSKRTVETHITNILAKLGFTSRGQIAAWAIKKGLTTDKST